MKEVVVAGIPLMLIVIGLVQLVRSAGVEGKALRFWAMGFGSLLGIGYHLTLVASFSWPNIFGALILGLLFGLGATGAWDVSQNNRPPNN